MPPVGDGRATALARAALSTAIPRNSGSMFMATMPRD